MYIRKIMSNMHSVEVPGKGTFYFSYETCIAVESSKGLFITKNIWSNTTGKHLDYLSRDKNIRISKGDLDTMIEELLNGS